jgi:hypothetical protein
LQVAITGLAGTFGGGDQRCRSCGVVKRPRVDDFLDPGGASSLKRSRVELLDLAQHRHDNLALAELEGELGCDEEAPGAPPGRAQLRCSLQRRDGDSGCAAPPCACGCLLELAGDLFVGAADQCRAMPDAAVRLGAQDLGERLVHAAALRQARALAYGRADQRMAEAHAAHGKGDDRGLGGRFKKIEPERPPCQGTSGLQDLRHAFSLAECRDQQEQAGLL